MVLKDLRCEFGRDPETIWGVRKLLTPWTDRQQPGSRCEESSGPKGLWREEAGLMRQKWVLLFSEDGLFYSVSLQPGTNPQAWGRKERRGAGSVTAEVSQWWNFCFREKHPGRGDRVTWRFRQGPRKVRQHLWDGLWPEQQPCLDSNLASLEVWVKTMGWGSLPLNPSFFRSALWLCDLERRRATSPWCLCKMTGYKHN